MNGPFPVIKAQSEVDGLVVTAGIFKVANRFLAGISLLLMWGSASATGPVFQCEIEGKYVMLRSELSTWMPSLTHGCKQMLDQGQVLLPQYPPQPRPFDWPVMLTAPVNMGESLYRDSDVPAGIEIFQAVKQHATRNGLQPELVLAVIQAESAFNPRARSSKGALGLMQVLPSTAREYGIDRADELLAAEQNIRVGTVHLARLMRKFDGDVPLALAAYNAGEGAVTRSGWRVPPYRETKRYVQKVMHFWGADPEGSEK